MQRKQVECVCRRRRNEVKGGDGSRRARDRSQQAQVLVRGAKRRRDRRVTADGRDVRRAETQRTPRQQKHQQNVVHEEEKALHPSSRRDERDARASDAAGDGGWRRRVVVWSWWLTGPVEFWERGPGQAQRSDGLGLVRRERKKSCPIDNSLDQPSHLQHLCNKIAVVAEAAWSCKRLLGARRWVFLRCVGVEGMRKRAAVGPVLVSLPGAGW